MEVRFGDAIAIRRRLLGDERKDVAASRQNLATILGNQGNYSQAETLGSEAVWRAREALREGHWRTGVILGAYGNTLLKLERSADAEAGLLESHSILEAALGAKHERTVKTMNSFIDLYDAWHAAEADKDYDAKATEWRARLPNTEEF